MGSWDQKIWQIHGFLFGAAWLFGMAGSVGQVPSELNWAEVENQLRGVYERQEWRARPWSAEWLPDSSGYVITSTTSDGGKVQTVIDVESGLSREGNTSAPANPLASPDGRQVLEVSPGRLLVRNLIDDSQRVLIESSAERAVTYRHVTWSPDGRQVLFVESDETDIPERLRLNPRDPSYPELRKQRFARVGGAIPKLRVGIVRVAEGQVVWAPVSAPDEGWYLGQVEWARNSHEVLLETLSRSRDRREFLLWDTETQRARTLLRENDPAWVDASQGRNLGLMWLQGGEQFIVISERQGWRQAYLFSRSGEELVKLTPGEYDIIERVACVESEGWFYFYASPDNATQKYLYRASLNGSGTIERVTPEAQPGTHDYRLSPDGRWAFHTYSTANLPPATELIELETGRHIRWLERNEHLEDIAARVADNPTVFFSVNIGDGISVDGWLMKPRDFNPQLRYPVLVYVYGEPHAQTVLDAWGTVHDPFHRTVADLGYLVVSFDNRGTPAPKGAAWRRAIFGCLGPLSTQEQAAALEELARQREYVDLSRVGIWGWSGGGSNTLNALFRRPDRYHVGVAVVPKPQPHLYNAWFQEIYMRTTEDNAEGYRQAAPLNFAEGLQGKLLIVTGSGETNTHIEIVEGLVDRLIELGKPFDYMVYPHRDHQLSEKQGTAVHLRMLIIRYLWQNLPAGGR